MKTISIQQFCIHYDVPQSFIDSLNSFELIELIEVEQSKHICVEDIKRIEKLIRLHYDLNVNFEGLDIISNLLHQVNSLHEEVRTLRNKLDILD